VGFAAQIATGRSPTATSARRMPIRNAAERLQTLVDEGRRDEIIVVNPSTESDQAQR
jgi:hypothetical protein